MINIRSHIGMENFPCQSAETGDSMAFSVSPKHSLDSFLFSFSVLNFVLSIHQKDGLISYCHH